MAAVNKVLVIGGGFSGMAAAIALRKAGSRSISSKSTPTGRPEGAGITINGASLRAFETLGVYDEIAKRGFVANGVELCVLDRPRRDRRDPDAQGSAGRRCARRRRDHAHGTRPASSLTRRAQAGVRSADGLHVPTTWTTSERLQRESDICHPTVRAPPARPLSPSG